jgi:TPR repeat protein
VVVWWWVRPQTITLEDERTKAEALILRNAPVQDLISEGVKAESSGYRDVAARLFKHAVDNNNAEGARYLGLINDPTRASTNSDRNPKADLWTAFIWYTKAAVLGDGVAAKEIDRLKGWVAGAWRDGDRDARLIRQDFPLASAKAMIEGNVPAGAVLDQAKKAQGTNRFDIAILLFRHAAEHNSAEGARRLGMIYDPTSPTVDPDHHPKVNARFAYNWYKTANEMGDSEAVQRLAQLMTWAETAAARGDEDAQQLIDRPGKQ